MSSMFGRLILALLFFTGGAALWTIAQLERAVAGAHARLVTLSPNAASAYDNIERSMPNVSRVPRVGDVLLDDVRTYRLVADYWGSDYDLHGAADLPDAEDGEQQFVHANAAYRLSRQQRVAPRIAVQQLDSAARRYAAVLEQHPEHVDAAYNYEFVVRLRNRIARANTALSVTRLATIKGDLPTGPTIHGDPGAPPKGVNLGQFDLLIPLQSDEDVHTDGKKKSTQKKG